MNNQTIEINNIEFKNYKFIKAQYFGYEILINDDDKYINITKLLNIINNEHRKNHKPIKEFRKLKQNDDYKEFEQELKEKLIKTYGRQNSVSHDLTYELRLGPQANHINGIYIHEDLLNYVLMWADKKYAIYVNDIMKELNNNNINQVNNLVEELKNQNQQLQNQNQQLKNEIETNKSKLIQVKSNELETNNKIKIYENIINKGNKTYKISYDQNKYLDPTQYNLINEFKTNTASNIVKSDGLKQYYINKKSRTFTLNNLKNVINYIYKY